MMQQLMTMDKGSRRVDVVALEGCQQSPAHAVSSLGSASFREPLERVPAEHQEKEDHRVHRRNRGYVPFSNEPVVPDQGGLGWRTKTGHMVKNQAYYEMKPINKWDSPTHAGVNTWKEFHGPRMRTDADTMERLDTFEQRQEEWEAKKTFVNTTRVQTLDRFYNRKVHRTQLEAATNWAPHHHARREVHSKFDTFDGTLDEKPVKQLKKVLTPHVMKTDRDAVRFISKRIQNEETWKLVFKQMEAERRADIRADFQQRQAHTDRLMQMSGQPIRAGAIDRPSLNNCSQRSEELAQPRQLAKHKDVTTLVDFRGLVHCDNEHAMEAMMPGSGHELSTEFRSRATDSIQAGWPPPPPAETPRLNKQHSREAALAQNASVTKASIPASAPRLQGIGVRSNDELHMRHSKAQFLRTRAPPPPNQNDTLLEEDWSPAATLRDKARVTGDFSRTSHSTLGHAASKSMERLPPPRRQYVYHMMAPTSPKAKDPTPSHTQSQLSLSRHGSSPAILGGSPAGGAKGKKAAQAEKAVPVSEVCRELDTFEAGCASMPRICNFFHTPRATGSRSAQAPEEREGAAPET